MGRKRSKAPRQSENASKGPQPHAGERHSCAEGVIYEIPRTIIAEEILTFCCVNRRDLAGNVDISNMHFTGLGNY